MTQTMVRNLIAHSLVDPSYSLRRAEATATAVLGRDEVRALNIYGARVDATRRRRVVDARDVALFQHLAVVHATQLHRVTASAELIAARADRFAALAQTQTPKQADSTPVGTRSLTHTNASRTGATRISGLKPDAPETFGGADLVLVGLHGADRVLTNAGKLLQNVGGQVGGDSGQHITSLGERVEQFGTALGNIRDAIAGADLPGVISGIGSVLAAGIDFIADGLSAVSSALGIAALQTAADGLHEAADAVVGGLEAAASVVGDALSSAASAISGALGGAAAEVGTFLGAVAGAISEAASALVDGIGGLIDGVVSFFANLFGVTPPASNDVPQTGTPTSGSGTNPPSGDGDGDGDGNNGDPVPGEGDGDGGGGTENSGDSGDGATGGTGHSFGTGQRGTGLVSGDDTSIAHITAGLVGGLSGATPNRGGGRGGDPVGMTPDDGGTDGGTGKARTPGAGARQVGQGARQFVPHYDRDPSPDQINAATLALSSEVASARH
jgi:hypothetical protein